jgi:CspA family cold shock protein
MTLSVVSLAALSVVRKTLKDLSDRLLRSAMLYNAIGPTVSTGTVRWFSYSKGCGFITPDDGGADVFAHFSALGGLAVQSLDANARVRYDMRLGPKGVVASNISLLG